jgi:hypothetical protein
VSCHIPDHELQCDEHVIVEVERGGYYQGVGARRWVITLETNEGNDRVSSRAVVSWVKENTLGKGELSAIQHEITRMKYAIERAIEKEFG